MEEGRASTAVGGGLVGDNGESWKDYLWKKLWAQGIDVDDLYWKGGWAGILWVKCRGVEGKQQVVEYIKALGVHGVWATADRVLEDRVLGSFSLGLKRQLVAWGFSRAEVRVHLESKPAVMEVGGKEVLKVGVQEGKLDVKWVDAGWREWEDLTGSREYQELLHTANGKLEKGGGGKGKGKHH